jgi:hypothetical protein
LTNYLANTNFLSFWSCAISFHNFRNPWNEYTYKYTCNMEKNVRKCQQYVFLNVLGSNLLLPYVGIPFGNHYHDHIAYFYLCNYLQKFCLSKVDSQVMINKTIMTYIILFLFLKICFCDYFLINWNSFIIIIFFSKTSNNPIVINNQTTTNAHMLKKTCYKKVFCEKKNDLHKFWFILA